MPSADTLAVIGTQLVTMLGVLYYLGQRIDRLGRDLRGEMTETRKELHGAITATRKELHGEIRATRQELRDEITTSRGELAARLDAHIERHAG
jgi:hypothetical protein